MDYRARDGRLLDDVLVTFFQGPASYSGEDLIEISCHGNPFIAQQILEDLLARGCLPAEPGEFTQRAFLNGRLDLSEAEAVMDLIHARSERALAAANQQLRGGLKRRMDGLIEKLLGVLARIEAYIEINESHLVARSGDDDASAVADNRLTPRLPPEALVGEHDLPAGCLDNLRPLRDDLPALVALLPVIAAVDSVAAEE